MQNFIHGLETVPPVVTYGFAFIWLALESCGLPLPNELVLLLLGSLIEQRGSPAELVALVLVATAGSLLGATAAYFIGARGGRAAVLRVGRYLRLSEARLDSVERWLASSSWLAIGIARITPFVRTVASFPAGVLRLPLRTFIIATSVGSLLWCVALVTVGYILGEDYMLAVHFIETYTLPAVIILIALVGGYIWLHQRLAHVGAPQRAEASRPAGAGGRSGRSSGAKGSRSRRYVSRERQRPRR